MKPVLKPFKPEDYLDTPERIAAFLNEAAAEDDPAFMIKAVGIAARARGMRDVAEMAGRSRENLYRALSESGNPEASTLLGVLNALGLRVMLVPAGSKPQHQATRSASDAAAFGEPVPADPTSPKGARRRPRKQATAA